MVKNKTVLLIVSGAIAAYKTLELIRRLKESDIHVIPVMTEAAKNFITPLSVSALAEAPVHSTLFDLTRESEMSHIRLSRIADLTVVAPASADILSKMAHGVADDLASTLLLATDTPILVAPSMNVRMWEHPATQRNIATLRKDGVHFIGPDKGSMACGEYGTGRMAEVADIIPAIKFSLAQTAPYLHLQDKHIVITSGPTVEPIDPIRFISNYSSGKQGHAIANALHRAGATVTLVTGPVEIPPPFEVTTINVKTAQDMYTAVTSALPADVFISVAAVSDWRPIDSSGQKIKKKTRESLSINYIQNIDILSHISHHETLRPQLVIGFCAETENLISNAQDKLKNKGCDWIIANQIHEWTPVFGSGYNTVHFITQELVEPWPQQSKLAIATTLTQRINTFFS